MQSLNNDNFIINSYIFDCGLYMRARPFDNEMVRAVDFFASSPAAPRITMNKLPPHLEN